VRFGSVRLPRDLHPGQWVELDRRHRAALLGALSDQASAEVVGEAKSC